jgi:hypothetical protein
VAKVTITIEDAGENAIEAKFEFDPPCPGGGDPDAAKKITPAQSVGLDIALSIKGPVGMNVDGDDDE